MKKIVFMAIAFAIGTSSLFATSLDTPPPHKNFSDPDTHSPFEANDKKAPVKTTSNGKEDSDTKNYTYVADDIQQYNLNYNNKELLLEEMRMEAVKKYRYIMPDIIMKE
jgi:hypothetical protein